MCKKAAFFGEERGREIIGKIQHLEGTWIDVTETENDKKVFRIKPADVIDRLYGILTILDGKANGLLRFNSLFLTLLVFFLGWSHGTGGFPQQLSRFELLAYIDTGILLASSGFCLLIVRVKWKFLGYVTNGNFETEINRLGNVVDDRTHYFWLAWWGTVGALILSVLWWLIPTL